MTRPDMQAAFELASLREVVRELATLPDARAQDLWARVREMTEKIDAERDEERRLHGQYYDARVEQQKNAVRDDDKAPHRNFEPEGYGGAKFDERMIERLARHRVDTGHYRRLAELDQQEALALKAIRKQAGALLRSEGRAEREFNAVSRQTSRRRGRRRSRHED